MGVPYAPDTRIAISLQRVIRSTSCLVLQWGFRGRRIERRYLRFEQIQDGGRRHLKKISNGHISATGRPIHFMFCSRVGFSGTADLMALFTVRTNSKNMIANGTYWGLATALSTRLKIFYLCLSMHFMAPYRGYFCWWLCCVLCKGPMANRTYLVRCSVADRCLR